MLGEQGSGEYHLGDSSKVGGAFDAQYLFGLTGQSFSNGRVAVRQLHLGKTNLGLSCGYLGIELSLRFQCLGELAASDDRVTGRFVVLNGIVRRSGRMLEIALSEIDHRLVESGAGKQLYGTDILRPCSGRVSGNLSILQLPQGDPRFCFDDVDARVR